MVLQELFDQVIQHIVEVISRSSPLGENLWKRLNKVHPADIAEFLERIEEGDAGKLFQLFPRDLQIRIFDEMNHSRKVILLESLSEAERSNFLMGLSIDELTDFFDDLSDEELKHYLKLLHKKSRERVLSLLKFAPDSAGGIMYTDVLTLMQDFTVEKSIHILQRLRPNRALHHKIYVTTQSHELLGYINLEDLVLKPAKTRLGSIVKPDELVLQVDEDRQAVAQKMMHYGVSNAPVLGNDGTFLGVIPSQALVEIIEEEASEDIYRMSALSPIKYSYFETPFVKLLYQRSSILIILLLVQTLSSMIIARYEALLCGFLTYFISMLISTGGNASSQTSALAIQGMATGEIDADNSLQFIKRELAMSLILAVILSIFSFIRTATVHYLFMSESAFHLIKSIAVSVSLGLIVVVSIGLGSCMPFVLKRCNIDPAHSAGPLLTTIIDVVGLLIYCVVSSWIIWVSIR